MTREEWARQFVIDCIVAEKPFSERVQDLMKKLDDVHSEGYGEAVDFYSDGRYIDEY